MYRTSRSKLSFFSFRPQAGGDVSPTVRDRPPTPSASSLAHSANASGCRRIAASLMSAVALTVVAAGCDIGRSDATPTGPSTPSTLTSATPSPDERVMLLNQYRKFWITLTPISRMPTAVRRTELAKVAIDPELKSLLAGMSKNDRAGQVFYGAAIPHPRPVPLSPDRATAVVDDCQDAASTGLATRSTLAPVTVGVARNHVVVTMKKAPDGLWKVAFVSHTKTPC